MRRAPIDAQLFVTHRANLQELLLPSSLAIANANDILPTNADGVLSPQSLFSHSPSDGERVGVRGHTRPCRQPPKPASHLPSPTLRASCSLSVLSLFRAFGTLSLLSLGQPPPS